MGGIRKKAILPSVAEVIKTLRLGRNLQPRRQQVVYFPEAA